MIPVTMPARAPSASIFVQPLALLALVLAAPGGAAAIDQVDLTVQPGSTFQLTLGVSDRAATDTDTSSVAGVVRLNLDDATNPTAMTFDGTVTHLTTPDNFDFNIDLGLLGGLDAQVLGAAGPIYSPRPGDANGDGLVDGADFTIWGDHFDGGVGAGDKTPFQGDWSGDGFVDGADFTLWADNFDSLTPAVSGGQYDLSQHLGLINEGSAPYAGTGFLSGLVGTIDFAAENVALEAPPGQMGSLTSVPTGNPNEYLITLTIPWNFQATIEPDFGVTLDTVTMITATGLFTDALAIPEPGGLVLVAVGALGLLGLRRKR